MDKVTKCYCHSYRRRGREHRAPPTGTYAAVAGRASVWLRVKAASSKVCQCAKTRRVCGAGCRGSRVGEAHLAGGLGGMAGPEHQCRKAGTKCFDISTHSTVKTLRVSTPSVRLAPVTLYSPIAQATTREKTACAHACMCYPPLPFALATTAPGPCLPLRSLTAERSPAEPAPPRQCQAAAHTPGRPWPPV